MNNNTQGKSYSKLARFILFLAIFPSLYMVIDLVPQAIADDSNVVFKWFYFGPLTLLFMGICVFGIWIQFWKTVIDENGIMCVSIKRKIYKWNEIQGFYFPSCYLALTQQGKVLLKNGKIKFIPFGDNNLREAALKCSASFPN